MYIIFQNQPRSIRSCDSQHGRNGANAPDSSNANSPHAAFHPKCDAWSIGNVSTSDTARISTGLSPPTTSSDTGTSSDGRNVNVDDKWNVTVTIAKSYDDANVRVSWFLTVDFVKRVDY
uniref:Uncharacterized protein n=1 Tax=Caenorhabditis japonica TaxID=281687 RepID=A0A8R1IJY6_CAEJA